MQNTVFYPFRQKLPVSYGLVLWT